MSDETTPDLTALLAEALSRGTSGRYFLDYGVTPAHLADQITAAGFGPVRAVQAERDAARGDHGGGWFWSQAEWADWSNDLARLVPEEYGDDVAQEAIIERALTDLRTRAESAEAALAGLREGIEALAAEFARRQSKNFAHNGGVSCSVWGLAGAEVARLLAPTPDREEARDE